MRSELTLLEQEFTCRLVGVVNGKIRDNPRLAEMPRPCLKIQDQDFNDFKNLSPRLSAEKTKPETLITVNVRV